MPSRSERVTGISASALAGADVPSAVGACLQAGLKYVEANCRKDTFVSDTVSYLKLAPRLGERALHALDLSMLSWRWPYSGEPASASAFASQYLRSTLSCIEARRQSSDVFDEAVSTVISLARGQELAWCIRPTEQTQSAPLNLSEEIESKDVYPKFSDLLSRPANSRGLLAVLREKGGIPEGKFEELQALEETAVLVSLQLYAQLACIATRVTGRLRGTQLNPQYRRLGIEQKEELNRRLKLLEPLLSYPCGGAYRSPF